MERIRALWQQGIKIGLIGGFIGVNLALIGMVQVFNQRQIVTGVISMGQALLLISIVYTTYLAAKRTLPVKPQWIIFNSSGSGLATAFILVLYVLLGINVNIRWIFPYASPESFDLLTFGLGKSGMPVLLALGVLIGALVGGYYLLPKLGQRIILWAVVSVFSAGVLQDLIRPIISERIPRVTEWLLTADGLTIRGALAFAIVLGLYMAFWSWRGSHVKQGWQGMPIIPKRSIQVVLMLLGLALLLYLPHLLGLFLSEVITIVGIYVLLGLGLNIVVGYAGLLDLGYVAFFAIGAYVTALVTSPEFLSLQWSLWAAVPVAVVCGLFAGVLLGIPVLKMRGDYLAIATMGFGEIIRLLVLSDALKPYLGGSLGISYIAKAKLPFGWLEWFGVDCQSLQALTERINEHCQYVFQTPKEIYYLIIVGCFIVIFFSLRLKDSRLGRAWKAMREDEDVAQAMGINLVSTKLLAFGTGAAFSALGGLIFSSKLGSIYPQSFGIMVSVNVVCLIIFGGIGSIPGVIVGAAALVGLPELLREFAEYRYLVYGIAIVVMMLIRPEGLWPEAIRKREMQKDQLEGAA